MRRVSLSLLCGLVVAGCYESIEPPSEAAPVERCDAEPVVLVVGEALPLSVFLHGVSLGTASVTIGQGIAGVDYEIDGEGAERAYRALEVGTFEVFVSGRNVAGAPVGCATTLYVSRTTPAVACIPTEATVHAGNPVPIRALLREKDGPFLSMRWSLDRGVPVSIDMADRRNATVTVAHEGDAILRFRVANAAGESGECTSTLHAEPTATLDCGVPPDVVRLGDAVELTAEWRPVGHELTVAWTLDGAPEETYAQAETSIRHTFAATTAGDHEIVLQVDDAIGGTGQCRFVLHVHDPRPQLACTSSSLDVPAVAETSVVVSDDEPGVQVSWSLVELPDGSRASGSGASERASFAVDLVGRYVIRFDAIDADGNTATCDATVTGTNHLGLRVELTWPPVGTDLDVHLLRPDAPYWNTPDDCYFETCKGAGGAPWFPTNPLANPRLWRDDWGGGGPEVITIERPEPGTYRVGVICAHRCFAEDDPPTVRVYCEADGPSAVGSATLPFLSYPRGTSNEFWRAVDVTVDAQGHCSVAPVARANGTPYTTGAFTPFR